jgi:hypothetical protein
MEFLASSLSIKEVSGRGDPLSPPYMFLDLIFFKMW